ncbi:MAG: UDP-N-acetylenolpyruvoylglucosamine reductase [Legionellaceae bacterium]|nr:UDP-N-acetylenolpyruvoylglucosamine reductase [Legionellaceae bacterium]
MPVLESDIGLAQHTSWKVGGTAECFFQPNNADELSDFLQQLPAEKSITWLGLGSNLLVRDNGVRGVVIATFPTLNALRINNDIVSAQVGVACAQISRLTARQGLTGLEFLAGIPGTVGGALAMNAGCHQGEVWQTVKRVEMINRQGERYFRDANEFKVAYREVDLSPNEWFLSVDFHLKQGNSSTALGVIRDLLAKRAATQPTSYPNCGSVFRNPPNDHAARLIEAAGLKGFKIGAAEVSTKHANFIINTGGATAADIERLIEHIEREVFQQFDIRLIREVRIVGEK